ncbi:DUF6973 domain-containing protein [Tenacibaculum agarivorans]|uniref:DUF6973 domain-containing protein n=1 Tax=Tenacibaculum agarivorans TaxID=1908389 RepID=UPI00094BA0A3|nr:hypothetical protein [Tenacibaculum agarivorans]
MKKINLLILVTLFSFLSCTNEDNPETLSNQEESIDVQDLQYYKGIPVAHRFDVSVEELTGANLSKGNTRSKNLTVNRVNFDNYSLEQIVAAVEMELDKFPYIREESLPEEKIQLLQRDFPTLSQKEIQEKMPIIEEYYHQNLDYLAYDNLKKNKVSILSRTNDSYTEISCIKKAFKNYGGSFGSYALSAYAFYKASTTARDAAPIAFPGVSTDTKQDAYRHILWSSLLCRYYYTISSKAPKLRFAKAIGDVNEECGNNNADAREMDYHNNAIGRKIYDQNAPYKKFFGFTVGVRTPSVSNLKSKAKTEVDNAILIQGNSINEKAQTIKAGQFNCTTRYIRKTRFICEDTSTGELITDAPSFGVDQIDQIDYNQEECWEVYYETYKTCNGDKAVYLR